jgi:membrane fusion protein, multidrug efflux system
MNHKPLNTSIEPPAPTPKRRTFWIVIGVVLILFVLLLAHHHRKTKLKAKAAQAALSATLPMVNVDTALLGTSRHYLNALGSVTALNSIVVRSRVDGQLMNVYFREGQLVRNGALLALIDPRPAQVLLTEAQGQIARDQSLLAQAEQDLGRYRPLAEHQAIPQQQKDQQDALVEQYRGAVQADSGQIANANLQLDYSHITAPISGRIGLRLVDPGNIVHASDATGILTITQVQPIAVVFNLAEDDLPALQRALRANAHLSVQAWDRANQAQIASGQILSLDNTIDPASGTLKIKASFDNKQGDLFPNEFVNIRVQTEVRQHVLLVPDAAVQRNGDTTYVYLLSGDGMVYVRPVQSGQSDAGKVEILSGLQTGDVVVTRGFDKLQDGLRVTVARGTNAPQVGSAQ